MLRLGVANELGVVLAVIVFPFAEFVVAVSVAHFVMNFLAACSVVRSRSGLRLMQMGVRKRIVLHGTRQHWPLIVQPPEIANEHYDHQRSGAGGNADLSFREGHSRSVWRLRKRPQDYQRETRTDMYERGARINHAAVDSRSRMKAIRFNFNSQSLLPQRDPVS